jgi:hypothetical protein
MDKLKYEAKLLPQPNGCWYWKSKDNHRYPRVWHNGRQVYVMRVAYMLYVGSVPEGMEVDHAVCNDKRCVNYNHLEAVPHSINVQRYFATRTHCVHGHKYTPESVYHDKRGYKQCRICHRDRLRVARVRLKTTD